MKLSTLKNEADIKTEPTGVDLDALEKIGPILSKNLKDIDSLIKLIPGSNDIIQKFKEFKNLLSGKIKLQSNVLEDVIHKFDKNNPMDDSEILILGGAGRYTMKGVKIKAARECQMIAEELVSNNPDYKTLAAHCKQTANTLDTIVAAITELDKMNMQETLESTKIDALEIKETNIPGVSDIQAMFETLHPTLGDAAWIAISRKLRSEGIPNTDIIEAIDATIAAQLRK